MALYTPLRRLGLVRTAGPLWQKPSMSNPVIRAFSGTGSNAATPQDTNPIEAQKSDKEKGEDVSLADKAGSAKTLWTGETVGSIPRRKQFNILQYPKVDLSGYIDKSQIQREEDELVWSESMGVTLDRFRRLTKRVLHIRRTSNMTRKGKIPSMYALVVVGTGEGAAGFGEGKGEEVADAIRKATSRAIKNLTFVPRYGNRTVYHDITHKFKATQLQLFARPPGFGKRVNPYVYEICQCVGIQDIAGKVRGSRNPMNVIKCTFEALLSQRTPEDIALARGKRLVDVNQVYYGGLP
ncbi:28S ribosomal protein S5, mitochondrial [Dispira parvispora]|uniref:Small ribosomal subunit protein uS5m n=1 Tax=Dispira parvispora TaxID=1520584 RepID=A0A9W8E1I7_9FUNG|nr:28S ribosomal protein S5, mitochondrial [Dispira parvispora]